MILVYIFIVLAIILTARTFSSSSISSHDMKTITTHRLLHFNHVLLGHQDPLLIKASAASAAISRASATIVPSSYENWRSSYDVLDQGPWGSCTAFATRYAYMIRSISKNLNLSEPSTSYWYAQSRLHLGVNPLTDSGSTLTSTAWVLSSVGTPSLTQWPYSAQNIFTKPTIVPDASTKISIITKLPIYASSISNISEIKSALSSGCCVVVSIHVYNSFMTVSAMTSGMIPLPNTRKETLLGGHAICLTGYNDSTSLFTFTNSWGTYTGLQGRFQIPYAYISSNSLAGEYYKF